jgi:magnesium-transporting ATPase (P-type)
VGNYSGEKYLVMDGPDFRRAVLDSEGNIRQDVFDLVWSRLRVLARCSPADKYTIVQGVRMPHCASSFSTFCVGLAHGAQACSDC